MNQPVSADEIFAAALALTDSSGRSAYLDRACAGNLGLRQEVASLLAAAERAGTFLGSPATGSVAMLRETPDVDGSPPTEKAGSRIGRYKLLEQIGEGGFGVVWMAEQEESVRRVALKIMKLGMDTKETGQAVSPPLEHRAAVWWVAFSPNGRLLATATAERSIRVWESVGKKYLAGFVASAAARRPVAELSLARPGSASAPGSQRTGEEPDAGGAAKTSGPAQPASASAQIPDRDPRAGRDQIVLTRFYNASLAQGWQTPEEEKATGNDLSELPRGLVELGGVRFDVRGIVQVSGQSKDPRQRKSPPSALPQNLDQSHARSRDRQHRLHFRHDGVRSLPHCDDRR